MALFRSLVPGLILAQFSVIRPAKAPLCCLFKRALLRGSGAQHPQLRGGRLKTAVLNADYSKQSQMAQGPMLRGGYYPEVRARVARL